MMTSTAKSFGGLLLARVGVGIGEAGCSPPIHSMISDYFPENKRATALAIYAMGIPIGGAIGTLAGGWIGEYYGWRMAFLLVGCPGIILSLVVYLTIREPVRGLHRPVAQQKAAEVQIPLKETIRFMWGLRSFRHLSFAGSLHAFVGYGVALFMPSFFMRIHGYGLAETSSYLFLIGLTGVIGTFFGGLFGRSVWSERPTLVHVVPRGCDLFIGAVCGLFLHDSRSGDGAHFSGAGRDSRSDVSGSNLWYDSDAGAAADASDCLGDPAFCIEFDWFRFRSSVCGHVE